MNAEKTMQTLRALPRSGGETPSPSPSSAAGMDPGGGGVSKYPFLVCIR